MKKITVTLIVVLLILNASAQKKVTDSLKQLLNTAMPDTTRVVLLKNLGNKYAYSKPDSAMVYYQQGLDLARKINFTKGQQMCLNNSGVMFQVKGNYPKALNL